MKGIISYFVIFLMIAIAPGSLLFILFRRVMILLYILLCGWIIIMSKKKSIDNSFLYLVGLCLLMIMTSYYNNTVDTEFIVFIIFGFLTYLLMGTFTLESFKLKFLNVVCVISIISITIFSIYSFWGLPLSRYTEAYVDVGHFFYHTLEWDYKPLERNTAFFTEPGCFQYCLNYALILFFDDIVSGKLARVTKIKIGIIVLALLTCASTVGFFVLVILSLAVFIKSKVSIIKKIFIIIPIMGCFLWYIYDSDSVSKKLDPDVENESVLSRTADALAMVSMIEESPLFGNGGSNTKEYIKKVQGYGAWGSARGDSNGILAAVAMLGVLWPLLYCYFCIKGCKKICTRIHPWFIVMLLLLINSNEFVIFHPITYIFIFPCRTVAKFHPSLKRTRTEDEFLI